MFETNWPLDILLAICGLCRSVLSMIIEKARMYAVSAESDACGLDADHASAYA